MKLFITGPQRSGTTFVANCLALSFGIKFIDEAEFDAHFYGKFKYIAKQYEDWVVHGPALFHNVFDVINDFPDVTFVVVRRKLDDILASQTRISWGETGERNHMNLPPWDDRPIAEIKYSTWDNWKKLLPSWVEYRYEDFEVHPMWVPKERREKFHSKQWKEQE
jgi:hypothetical protein